MAKQFSSAIRLGRQACLRVALEPVSSFDDGTPQGLWLSECYETIVRSRLSGFAWNFATEIVTGTRLDEDVEYLSWGAVYARPPDALSVRAVLNPHGDTLRWKLMTERLEVMTSGDEDIRIQYMTDVDESSWHPTFRAGVVLELASGLALGIKRDGEMSVALNDQAEMKYAEARHICSAEHTPQRLRMGRLRRLNR